MATRSSQTVTAKGTAVAKSSGTTLTIPDVSMVGGDFLMVATAWDKDEASNPTVFYGGKEIDVLAGGVTTTAGGKRVRVVGEIVNNTRTADLVITWPSAITARVVLASSLHQAGKDGYTDENENVAATISTAGANEPIKHIQTTLWAAHLTEGPAGDAIGSSSTGCTLGQRVGTTGDADTTNVTLQETYKIIDASTVAAGSFVIGDDYQIKTIGTTDFTAIGAASNTVGVQFTATGVGSGTGDAYHLEDARSRLSGLALRDHVAIMYFMQPRQTFTIKDMVQYHRLMNHNPDWVEVKVEDELGNGFWFNIDPDQFDDWSDAVVEQYVTKMASTWVVNNLDSNLEYEADTARDARMATFIDDQVIL